MRGPTGPGMKVLRVVVGGAAVLVVTVALFYLLAAVLVSARPG